MTETKPALKSPGKLVTTAIGLVVTALASLVAKYGIELSDATVSQIAITVSGLFAVLIGAKGAADFGKNAVEAAKTPSTEIKLTGAEDLRRFDEITQPGTRSATANVEPLDFEKTPVPTGEVKS